MDCRTCFRLALRACGVAGVLLSSLVARADVAFEGFLPFVGMALTDKYDTFDTSATFFIAKGYSAPVGQPLGPGSSAYYDIALLDTGAATHILTSQATAGFNIDAEGFDGTNFQAIGGATGIIDLRINDPLGVFVGGMGVRTGAGASLTMDFPFLHGQTNIATLSAPAEWTLPNIVGLPMAAQHGIKIRNSDPQIFTLQGRTVRTPDIEFFELGQGVNQGITRRVPLVLKPGAGFIQGPLYVQNLDFSTLDFHENPLSPTIVESGGLFVELDLADGANALNDKEFLFDTGASLTVVSEQTAVRLGFDPILDTPDFELSVEGSGGVTAGIPGFFVDELRLDSIGGSFVLHNVPVAVLDVTNPNDPGNVVPGILGTNVFANRDLVIDAQPSVGQGGIGPSLFISDPVTQQHTWGTSNAVGNWTTASSWSAAGVPNVMWDAVVANVSGSNQTANLNVASTVYRATISGNPNAEMTVSIGGPNGKLTTFADVVVENHGRLHLAGGTLDAQFLQLDGGTLTGSGDILLGSGPIDGSVRNVDGLVAPGDPNGNVIGTLHMVGDLANIDGTLAFDLGGLTAGTQYDQINVDRLAFLSGTLRVDLADLGGGPFSPNIGDSFTLLTAAEGLFGTFEIYDLPIGFEWDVNFSSTMLTIAVTGLGLVGDFSGNGILDHADINRLTLAVSQNDDSFDITGDGQVDQADIEEWVVHLKGTVLGDANLDGFVDISDFNTWNSNKLNAIAEWCSGDFNGDGLVDASDFNIWNSHKFQSGTALVPEPSAWGLLAMLGCLGLPAVRRRGGAGGA